MRHSIRSTVGLVIQKPKGASWGAWNAISVFSHPQWCWKGEDRHGAYRGLKPESGRENLKRGRPQIWGSVLHGPQWSWRVSSTCEFSGDAISYRHVPQASTDLSWDHLREPQYSKYSNNVINVVSFYSYTGLRDNGKYSHCATDMKLNFQHSTELRKKPQWSKALGSRSVGHH